MTETTHRRIPQFVHVVTNVPTSTGRTCDYCASASVAYAEWANGENMVVAWSHVCNACGTEMDRVR